MPISKADLFGTGIICVSQNWLELASLQAFGQEAVLVMVEEQLAVLAKKSASGTSSLVAVLRW